MSRQMSTLPSSKAISKLLQLLGSFMVRQQVLGATLLLAALGLVNIAARPAFPPADPFTGSRPSFVPTPVLSAAHRVLDVPTPPVPPSVVDSLAILEGSATDPPASQVTPTSVAMTSLEIEHVVLISIDGLRPDALFLAYTPHLDKLIERGAYCPHSQTVSLSLTLPGHASMLTGTIPDKHGILWGIPYIGWPGMNGPTLFSIAHEAGLSSAVVLGKEKLNYLVLPNSVDQVFSGDTHDPQIRDWALEIIRAGLPHVLFIHFPDTDRVGHDYGWMSENQLFAITYVDGLVGEIVAELEHTGYINRTLLIVTADHGGNGFGHGDDSPLDRTIPWLAVGPRIKSGIILTSTVYTYDTAATVLYALDLPIPEHWEGKPVLEIFQPTATLAEARAN